MEGGLCGLVNFGATCYLNSILQSLFNNEYILDNVLMEKKYKINNIKSDYLLIDTLEQLLKDIWRKKCILGPKPFIYILSKLENMDINEQNDPDEFYEKIISRLYDETCFNEKTGMKIWDKNFNDKNSFVNINFYGLYKSEINCSECNHSSISHSPFITLKLELVNNNIIECLKSHLSWEKNIDYTCEKCKKEINARKRFTIVKTPNVFVITLKRYNNFNEKNNMEVNYPLLFEIDNSKLELYCIVLHYGSHVFCGHYTCIVKYINNNNWYHIDDESIEEVDIDTIDKSDIYMLFYKKK